jgi:hypothetical protein
MALAALFTEDADFVVITGQYLKGRNAIVTYHAGLFAGAFQGSRLDVTSVAIRFLRPDVAVARVATRRTENRGETNKNFVSEPLICNFVPSRRELATLRVFSEIGISQQMTFSDSFRIATIHAKLRSLSGDCDIAFCGGVQFHFVRGE